MGDELADKGLTKSLFAQKRRRGLYDTISAKYFRIRVGTFPLAMYADFIVDAKTMCAMVASASIVRACVINHSLSLSLHHMISI